MIYECLIDKRHDKFLIAKPKGWKWTKADEEWPFEIGLSEDVELGIFDRPVRIRWSKGTMEVMASTISASITREDEWQRQAFVAELNRRRYPINMRTLYQPIARTAAMVGDR